MSYYHTIKKLDSEDLSTKVVFYICFPIDENEESFQINESRFENIDNNSIYGLLAKNKLVEFSEYLTIYMKEWIQFKSKTVSINEKNKMSASMYDDLIQLTKMLKIIYQKNKYNFELTISDISENKATLKDKQLNEQISRIIEEEFFNRDLNDISLTYDEAKEEMIRFDDMDWFNDLHVDGYYMDCYDGLYFYPEKIVDELVFYYADTHSTKHKELNEKLIYKVLGNLEKRKEFAKLIRGAKPKNIELGRLCVSLSYLHRFHKFLTQSESDNIYNFPLFSDTNVFIYDFLNYWALISNNVQYEDNVLKANYIKAIINQNKKKRGLYEKNSMFKFETLINNIRLAKFGANELTGNDIFLLSMK